MPLNLIDRLQSVVAPLCELDFPFLTAEEHAVVRENFTHVTKSTAPDVISEALLQYPADRFALKCWIGLAQANGFGFHPDFVAMAQGVPTWTTRIGDAFAYGTSCKCCVAYRGLLFGAVMFILGLALG